MCVCGGGGGGGALISLTTVDNKKGCWNFSFIFSVCMSVCSAGMG